MKRTAGTALFPLSSRLRLLLVLLSGGCSLPPPEAAQPRPNDVLVHERWWALRRHNLPAGYRHQALFSRTFAGKNYWVTFEETVVLLRKGEFSSRREQRWVWLETEAGRPLRFRWERVSEGIVDDTIAGVVRDDQLELELFSPSGNRYTLKIPGGKALVFPEKKARLIADALARGEKELTWRVFHAGLERVVSQTVLVGQRALRELPDPASPGEKLVLELTELHYRGEAAETALISLVDENGRSWQMRAMEGRLEWHRCGEKEALQSLAPDACVDAMKRNAVRLDQPLPNLRRTEQLTFRLRLPGGRLDRLCWESGRQAAEFVSPSEVRLRVRKITPQPGRAAALPLEKEAHLAAYLRPGPKLESDTPRIQQLARQAVGKERNALLAAKSIERFVSEHITQKGYAVGFASAWAVAGSRRGDCTEHALLCAALLRAVGIPSKIIFGLAPADDGTLNYHMWTGAYVGQDLGWIELDPTLLPPKDEGLDVAHLQMGETSLPGVSLGVSGMVIRELLGRVNVTWMFPEASGE